MAAKVCKIVTELSAYRQTRYAHLHELRRIRAQHRVHGTPRKTAERRSIQRELCRIRGDYRGIS